MTLNDTLRNVLSLKKAIDLPVIETLFAQGANPLTKSDEGKTFLEIAAERKCTKDAYCLSIQLCVKTGKLSEQDFLKGLNRYLELAEIHDPSIVQAFFDAGVHPCDARGRDEVSLFGIISLCPLESQIMFIKQCINTHRMTQDNWLFALAELSKSTVLSLDVLNLIMKASSDLRHEQYIRLSNGQMNDAEIKQLAETPNSKEGFIAFIQSKSEVEKKAILEIIFTPKSKLHVFFVTPRTWNEWLLGRNGEEFFDILTKMKSVMSKLLPEKVADLPPAYESVTDEQQNVGSACP